MAFGVFPVEVCRGEQRPIVRVRIVAHRDGFDRFLRREHLTQLALVSEADVKLEVPVRGAQRVFEMVQNLLNGEVKTCAIIGSERHSHLPRAIHFFMMWQP
jgi:hypothetical protein